MIFVIGRDIMFDFIELVLGRENKKGLGAEDVHDFVINSAKINPGDCFIGLQGVRCDGGDFFVEALKKGAIGFILHKKYESIYLQLFSLYQPTWAFFVDNTKLALILLAKKWRNLFNIPVIAITGSVGKTTTKELIKQILIDQGHFVCVTKNSENGSIGLPLTVLSMRKKHSIAVFEVGVQMPGEMDLLIDILQRVTYTVITTILPAHIVYFRDLQNIIIEKTKLQNITEKIVFIDYEFKKYIFHKNLITFGASDSADFYYSNFNNIFVIILNKENKRYTVNCLNNKGFYHCVLAAFAVCCVFNFCFDKIVFSIERFKAIDGRFSVHYLKNGSIIINDSWNAAHSTVMLNSIQAFEQFDTNNKKIMVLADMLEQGDCAVKMHDLIVAKVNTITQDSIERVFYIGESFKISAKHNIRKNIILADSFTEIAEDIEYYLNNKYCILFKGSNGTKLFYYITNYIINLEK